MKTMILALLVASLGNTAVHAADSVLLGPSLHLGDTPNSAWNPCASPTPDGTQWSTTFTTNTFSAQITIESGGIGGNEGTAPVYLDGLLVGNLTRDVSGQLRCEFSGFSEFTLTSQTVPEQHEIRIDALPFVPGGELDDFAIRNVILHETTPLPPGRILYREGSHNPSWDALPIFFDGIPGWDHTALELDDTVWESHPGYALQDPLLFWDPIRQEYQEISYDCGVQNQHTLGSFQHDSTDPAENNVFNDSDEIPRSVAVEMIAFIEGRLPSDESQLDRPFVWLCETLDLPCWQEVLDPDVQKGRLEARPSGCGSGTGYTCVGLVERAAEEAGVNSGEGFIPNSHEVIMVPEIGAVPVLSPQWLDWHLDGTQEKQQEEQLWLAGLFLNELDFVITDPIGRRLGHTADLGTLLEIPGGFYSGSGIVEQFYITDPLQGTYEVELLGLGNEVDAFVGGSVEGEMFSGQLGTGESRSIEILVDSSVPVLEVELNGRTVDRGVELRWVVPHSSALDEVRILRDEGMGPRVVHHSDRALVEGSWIDREVRAGKDYSYQVLVRIAGMEIASSHLEIVYAPSEIATRTRVLGNVPNPFNPRTKIIFMLHQPGDAHLTLYSSRGREIRSYHFEGLQAGKHTMEWDGTDSTHRPVASGVYYVDLEASGERDRHRLVLVR